MANINDNCILAIESAISGGSIALFQNGEFVGGASGGCSVSRAEDLLPRIIDLLSKAEVDRSELGRIAISLGPGSYTGLRIGISTVMGLGRGLGIHCVGVPLFEAIADTYDNGRALIAVPMGKTDVCISDAASGDARVMSLDDLKNEIRRRSKGVRLLVHSDLMKDLAENNTDVVDIGTNLARFIGTASQGQSTSTRLEPIYIQNPRFG